MSDGGSPTPGPTTGMQAADSLSRIGRASTTPSSLADDTGGDGGWWLSGILEWITGGGGSGGSGSSGSGSSGSGSTTAPAPGASGGLAPAGDPWGRVQRILDAAVAGRTSIGPHGPFWRVDRDRFVETPVLGFQIVEPGNGSGSNLVKALRGEDPFGRDTGSGGSMRRMPAGMPAISTGDIEVIRRWIDDGCPTGSPPRPYSGSVGSSTPPVPIPGPDASVTVDMGAGSVPLARDRHNAYWRDFDNWTMVRVAPATRTDIFGHLLPALNVWTEWVAGRVPESDWQSAIGGSDVSAAARRIASGIKVTLRNHYGDPLRMREVFESYQLFGAGELPEDPLRSPMPDPRTGTPTRRHQMDGEGMWFVWSAFADACLRLGIDVAFWRALIRAILVGLCNDGLFRGAFTVTGFGSGSRSARQAAVLAHVRGLADGDLQRELRRRYQDSGL